MCELVWMLMECNIVIYLHLYTCMYSFVFAFVLYLYFKCISPLNVLYVWVSPNANGMQYNLVRQAAAATKEFGQGEGMADLESD